MPPNQRRPGVCLQTRLYGVRFCRMFVWRELAWRMGAPYAQISHCVFDKPWLKMRRLPKEPACSHHLVHNKPRLIRSQIHSISLSDRTHNRIERCV